MRIMLIARMPHAAFNAAVKDGSVEPKIQAILEEQRAEAVYFTEMNGQRTAVSIVEMEHPSQIPALAEPWFLSFQADVEFHVAMKPQDLQEAGMAALGKRWG